MIARPAAIGIALIISLSTVSRSSQAANCANMMAQAGSAAVSLFAQTQRMLEVCPVKGWTSWPCLAQVAVVGQASVWTWWTSSNYYCECTKNPDKRYCAALGLLPAPAQPAGGGGGLAPAGPPPPQPNASTNPDIPLETSTNPDIPLETNTSTDVPLETNTSSDIPLENPDTNTIPLETNTSSDIHLETNPNRLNLPNEEP